MLDNLVNWSRIKSPWVCHFNAGACNACDIEILAALIPRFDAERFGILLKGTPRHADVLVCTGSVTKQIQKRLRRVYDQMPEPKFVLVVGSCGSSGGVFRGCYGMCGGIDSTIPVTVYVPGCPPRPDAILYGAVKILALLQKRPEEEIREELGIEKPSDSLAAEVIVNEPKESGTEPPAEGKAEEPKE